MIDFLYFMLIIAAYISSFWLILTDSKGGGKYRLSYHVILLAFLFFSLPAPLVYSGDIFEAGVFYKGFSFEVFSIYVLFAFSLNLAFILTILFERSRNGLLFYVQDKRPLSLFFLLLLLTSVFIYFVELDNLPNYSFFVDDYRLAYEKKQQLALGSGFLLSKFQIVLVPLALYVSIYYLMETLTKSCSPWVFVCLLVSFLLVLFYGTVRLSRGGLIYCFIAICLAYFFKRDKGIPVKFFLGILVIFFLMFYLIAYDSPSFFEVMTRINDRIVMQHGFIYIQLDLAKDIPFLNSFNAPVLFNILSNDYINVSKEAYDLYYNKDHSGTTAGLAFAQMYFSFGPLAFFVWTFIMIIFFYIDGLFYRSARYSNSMTAFYFTFYALYLIPILTNTYSFFSFSIFFSISFWIIVIFLFLVLKPKIIRKGI